MPGFLLDQAGSLDVLLVRTTMSAAGLAVTLLSVLFVAGWLARSLWIRHSFKANGDLLLQMELDGAPIAYIATLLAEERNGKPRYRWILTNFEPALPHTQMVDLAVTEIVVTQRRGDQNILSISALQRRHGFLLPHFHWIKDAAIGHTPGFPRKLLLPNNLVLRLIDE